MNKNIKQFFPEHWLLAAIFYFLLYGFLGWGIDTAYSTITECSWQPGGIFKSFFLPIPFAPIYGFGAWVLILFKNFLEKNHNALLFFISTVACTSVEYLGGIWMLVVFHRRAWDYRDTFLNIDGHIDLWHSFCWLILGLIFIKVIHPEGKKMFARLFLRKI
jgi:uncharacterized membrane protein